jgi:hypothetical protein
MNKTGLGTGCLVLFGLPFLLIGVGIGAWGVRSWLLYAQSGSWTQVAATVRAVEFVEQPDTHGSTYSVEVTYEYEYEGKTYTGHRVGILGGRSSSYETNQRRYKELDAARRNGKTVVAWVNPSSPDQAVLYRQRETWLLIMIPFGLSFAGAGALVIGLAIRANLRRRKLANIAANDFNRLWHARRDWAEGFVRASSVREILIYWGWSIGLSVFVSVFVIAVSVERAPLFAKAIVGFFCLIAALMLLKAVVLTLRQIVHGTPVLYLSEVPVVPGRKVLGAVRTHRPLRAERWRLSLRCYVPHADSESAQEKQERVSELLERLDSETRQGRGWRTTDWRGTCACSLDVQPADDAKEDRAGRVMLPVSIELRDGVPETSLDPGFSVYWVLAVRARCLPVSFSASFDLPVFYADEGEITRTDRAGR